MAIRREKAIQFLRQMQGEPISEAELYGAIPTMGTGKMVYQDPEDYSIAKAISDMEKLQKIESVMGYIDVAIRCAMCTNPMANDRGCDGGCRIDEYIYKKVMNVIEKEIWQIIEEVE